jgi:hypothetical protein
MHQTALLLRITVDGLLLFMLPCFLQSQGLSHCFERAKEGGLADVMVIEPISSSSLECMAAGKEILCPHSAATPAIHPMHGTGWGGGGMLAQVSCAPPRRDGPRIHGVDCCPIAMAEGYSNVAACILQTAPLP